MATSRTAAKDADKTVAQAPDQGEDLSMEPMTPELAEKLLSNNQGNRPVSMANVENFARLMSEGLWRYNGDTFRIAKDGTLLDGQHRLMAVVRSGVTMPRAIIVRNLENETQATMDQGKKRSASDVLGMAGFGNGNQIQSVARMVHDWKLGKRGIAELSKGSRMQMTPDEIRLWAIRDDNLRKAAVFSVRSGMRALCLQKASGTLWFLTNEADPDKCAEFFELLESGAGLEKGNPVLTVRNYWQNLRMQKNQPVARYLAAGVRAWNRWMTGETMSMVTQRLEQDIPDLYVPPGREDIANRYPHLDADPVPSPAVLTVVPGTTKSRTPKRKISPTGGDGSLFSER